MSNTNTNTGGGVLLPLLTVLFIGLKLGGVVAWSWIWVTAPLWGPFAVALGLALIFLPVAALVAWSRR